MPRQTQHPSVTLEWLRCVKGIRRLLLPLNFPDSSIQTPRSLVQSLQQTHRGAWLWQLTKPADTVAESSLRMGLRLLAVEMGSPVRV